MKYFTLDWYKAQYPGNGGDWADARKWSDVAEGGYARHLQEMDGKLSPDLLKLALLPGVDDALITLVRHNRKRRELALTLRAGDLRVGYYDLALRYDGAEISPEHERTLADIVRATINSRRFGFDACRHELDKTDDGRIEHRFLFHGGRWFGIRCDALRWARLPRRDRRFPRRADRFPGGPVASDRPSTT